MNPLRWIRWKVLITLVLVGACLGFVAVGPLAKAGANRLGAAGLGAHWNVQALNFNPLAGQMKIGGLVAGTCAAVPEATAAGMPNRDASVAGQGEPAQVFAADTIDFDLDMAELMRRRYCGQLHVRAPRILLERREDGSMNIDIENSTSADSPPTDWWEAAQNWMGQIRKWNDERRKMAEKIPQDRLEKNAHDLAAQKRSRFRVDYSQRVTYPFEHMVRFVASEVTGEGLEIHFVDQTSAGRARGAVPPLQNGRIRIENLSDRPAENAAPIRWEVSGDFAGSPIQLTGTLEEHGSHAAGTPATRLQLEFRAESLPVEVVQFFAGDSLPLHFDRGALTLAVRADISDWNELDVRPEFGFHDAVVSPRHGTASIAGVRPDLFCRAFNEVNTLDISDLRVTGTVARPHVELGHTITNLVRNSGKAIVKKELDKNAEKINQAVDKELGKLAGKEGVPPEVGRAVEEVKKGLGDRLKGLPFGEKNKPGTIKK
jgi:hypothetical protein